MELSSPRFKALTVSTAFSFWFLIITLSLGVFSVEIYTIFIVVTFSLMQIVSTKVAKVLNAFAIFNTKLFLGIFFVCVISLYGIFFRFLRIDLLRLNMKGNSYWLDIEQLKEPRIFNQY